MSKHTPGPWEYDGYSVRGKDKMILKLSHLTEEIEANARLIAAAPELLKALALIMSELPYGYCTEETQNIARSALAKARGE